MNQGRIFDGHSRQRFGIIEIECVLQVEPFNRKRR